MRSAEHALWDAHLARARGQAMHRIFITLVADAAPAMQALAHAHVRVGQAARDVTANMRAAVAAYRRAGPSAEDRLRLVLGKQPRGETRWPSS